MSSRLRAVLVDLSGTVHIDNSSIPGSHVALRKLGLSGVKIRYVTNTTKESLDCLHARLSALGLAIDKDHICTPMVAARKLIMAENLRPLLLLDKRALPDFEDIPTSDPNAVVVGLAPHLFDYSHLNEAFRLLLDGARFIALSRSKYFASPEGLSLGPGGFVAGLEFAAGISATLIGKPEPRFFLSALDDVDPSEAVMIGDDVADDVNGAVRAGLFGILVRTGKYREGDDRKLHPSAVCVDNLSSAVEYILANFTLYP